MQTKAISQNGRPSDSTHSRPPAEVSVRHFGTSAELSGHIGTSAEVPRKTLRHRATLDQATTRRTTVYA